MSQFPQTVHSSLRNLFDKALRWSSVVGSISLDKQSGHGDQISCMKLMILDLQDPFIVLALVSPS